MADSATNLDLVSQSQSGKEITINALADAASPAMLFGRRQSVCSGLNFGIYGGMFDIAGVPTPISNTTLTLTASSTNYIVALKSTGAISFSTVNTNWNNTNAYKRLYICVTNTTTVTSYTDYRTVTNLPTNAPRVTTVTTTTTAPVNVDTTDVYDISALATGCTFAAPSGTPSDEQAFYYRIKDDGTARALNWNAIFIARGVALPSTTIAGKYMRIGFLYNAPAATWDCIFNITEA